MNHTKFVKFQSQFDIKVKVKLTSFQTHLRHLDAQQTVQVGSQNLKQFNF